MRQVPNYLLIGNGRLARHLHRYLLLLNLSIMQWDRSRPLEELEEKIRSATHVLVLISDAAIEPFISDHLSSSHAKIIHCSGALNTSLAFGAHPLFTFTEQLYDLVTYQQIPFVVDDDAPAFNELFPGLPNRSVRLSKKLKSKYHALCVMSSNFTCLLWQKLFSSFEQELKIPAVLAQPLLLQQTKNLHDSPRQALTGPLARGDTQTIANNLAALHQDPFQLVYQSFIDCYAQLKKDSL